ncbi:MAG: cyclohexa-1,5-dienecarbonyl-CoA hydratase [Piscinibacter sp.]|uniref:cyclohexa-1,5-dienecarbonyl-CoA hydratase n=1 Tax=Piscinibacter sp. TaxID=1903157 RepID=UPI001B76C65D|nr:cyclohexa-1,5-dienecarbonyl-CoA hydratase [Piscinibacter sp.]MBP5990832.1 cyclohexa-1,5-dienecarbonyl-CoA hydratase [Piscinibacter sp.]MBP6028242.1 cyclohexa-1,5-dienecarbonyl-CoA hydratase [Piscinibacter sp.]
MAESPLKVALERDGALLHLTLNRPKANICDAQMIEALQAALDAHAGHAALRGVLLDAEGPHFSFGASVEEHLAERCAGMLASLHALILALAGCRVPVLVAVRGQCLGGGLEIALAGGPIFAAPNAQFGQPEIKLGVFAPAASCLLPWRVSAVAAEDLLCSGRSIDAAQALAIGLVQMLADDPVAAALAYFDEHLAPRSAAALAHAMQAARAPRLAALRDELARVERLYLQSLMKTRDANEGLAAFLAKRSPTWEHR